MNYRCKYCVTKLGWREDKKDHIYYHPACGCGDCEGNLGSDQKVTKNELENENNHKQNLQA